jgi:hypothetical protein
MNVSLSSFLVVVSLVAFSVSSFTSVGIMNTSTKKHFISHQQSIRNRLDYQELMRTKASVLPTCSSLSGSCQDLACPACTSAPLYCGFVSVPSADDTKVSTTQPPLVRTSALRRKLPKQQRVVWYERARPLDWRDKLSRVSNWASLLCVLDCTILPVITVVVPLLGLSSASVHAVGHAIALYFVLPVGILTTALNYRVGHRNTTIAALGVLGLLCILVSNGGCSLGHVVEHWNGYEWQTLGYWLHQVGHGLLHRLVNVMGCVCLMGSNYLSRKAGSCSVVECDC